MRTEHYAIHTTTNNTALLRDLTIELEKAHAACEQLAPTVAATFGDPAGKVAPMAAYVFAFRNEFQDHIKATTGPRAETYLKIQKGGYALDDTFVTYFHGDGQTLSVCRHEALHQYIDVHFRQRPPAFMEEGLATLFERGLVGGTIWSPAMDNNRRTRLIEAARVKRLWPLSRLMNMNAGHVIGGGGAQIDTFYAQAWALAFFLVSSPQYQDGFQQLLSDYATGQVRATSHLEALLTATGVTEDELSSDYADFVHELVSPAASSTQGQP